MSKKNKEVAQEIYDLAKLLMKAVRVHGIAESKWMDGYSVANAIQDIQANAITLGAQPQQQAADERQEGVR